MLKTGRSDKHAGRLILAGIILVTVIAFSGVLQSGFTDWDDDTLLTENPDVRVLSFENIQKIFTSTYVQTYIPLTVFSFAVEHALVGYKAWVYHFNNLLLHLGVVVLLYATGRALGLRILAAGLGALLFAVHPMHVESVAWITERKDVLYAFFYLGALYGYLKYLPTGCRRKYFLAVFLGLLSILAKSMALSLPLILFVLDWMQERKFSRWTFLDKLPFFLYVVPIAGITYAIHSRIPEVSVSQAVLTWIWSLTFYIRKFFWPVALKPLYGYATPVSLSHPEYQIALALFVLIAISLWLGRRHRWYIFAWLYYFLSIFFLLRFDHARDLGIVADRFMYLPSAGFCLWFGYCAERLFIKTRLSLWLRGASVLLAGILFTGLSVMTYRQVGIWKNKAMLWERLSEHFPDKAVAYNNQGIAFYEQGDFERALDLYNRSLAIDPHRARVYVNRGNVYALQQAHAKALKDYAAAIQLNPDRKEAYLNRAGVYRSLGRAGAAMADLNRSLKLDPGFVKAYQARAMLNFDRQEYRAASADYTWLIEKLPASDFLYTQRGLCYRALRQFGKAQMDFTRALKVNPTNVLALMNRGNLYGMQGRLEPALKDLNAAIALSKDNGLLYNDRGVIYGMRGDYARAIADYDKALSLNPHYAPTYYARSLAYRAMHETEKALTDARKARALGLEGLDAYIDTLKQ